MIRLKTERLWIYPISNDNLKQIIDAEQDLVLKQAYSEMLNGCIEHPKQRLWYALWLISLKEQPDIVVGDLSFKGLNPDGMIELGYGLKDGYCGNGYMTEAVKAICQWAVSQNDVVRVEAETTTENVASQRVLIRSGFMSTGIIGKEGPRYLYKNRII